MNLHAKLLPVRSSPGFCRDRNLDAIENGVADLSDPMLKDRIAELKAVRDQARADAERAEDAIDRFGPSITPQAPQKHSPGRLAGAMRTESGGYRRDHLRALAQRVEVDAKELRIMGSKSVLLRTLVAASSAKNGGFWRSQFLYERPETWVTFRTGHMGNTFRLLRAGGVDAVGKRVR